MVPKEMKLLNMLSNNDVTFFIPPYQRNYEWTDEQCEVFFDDIVKTHDRNVQGHASEHFFGSITFFQTETAFGQPDQLVLIDGQQRITTTMLFLVALRDILQDVKLKNYIDAKYLRNNNVSSDNDEYKIKLKQVETDWAVYKHIILGEEPAESEKNAAVYRNYQYFMNKLREYQKEVGDPASLIDKGLNRFSMISIELQPDKNEWENPQEIFESMNSLGKPLSLADLVRNYLLLGLDALTQDELYKKYWLHIEKTIPGQISNYIRDFMQWHTRSPFKKATEANYKELYRTFKGIFVGLQSRTILEQLAKYADIYRWILQGGETGSDEIDYELKDLQTLRVTTAYSFLMGLLAKWQDGTFDTHDMSEALDAFRIYCMRRRLMSITSAENKLFPVLVNRIDELAASTDKRQKMSEILASLESNARLPNDLELTRYLETANFYNYQYCKFVLALIEEKITKSRPNMSEKVLQIEHIMPQTLSEEWQKELGPDYDTIHQELVNTIGNLTLIRHNQELSNKSFAEKKKIYEGKAGLQIARDEITNQNKWDKNAILHRTQWMIHYLLQNVLPIPDAMRKANNFTIKAKRGLSFKELGLVGKTINFIYDESITAKVKTDKEVEFEGKRWRLTPLTKELCRRLNKASKSESYNGAQYWEYDGEKLYSLM